MDSRLLSVDTSATAGEADMAADLSTSRSQDPMEALEAYQKAVRSDLSEQSINESSHAVSSAVKQLVGQHESELRSLTGENVQLRDQLSRATALIDSLTSELRLSSTTLHTMQSGSEAASSFPSATEADARDEEEELKEDELGSMQSSHSVPSGLVDSPSTVIDEHYARLAALAEDELPSLDVLTKEPGALETFIAHYAELRGRVTHLLTEQRLWQHQLTQLTPLLRSMTVENANFRQTLTLLKATHVPLEALQEAVRERDEARTELRLLRLEAARLEHELADAEAQREQHELRLHEATKHIPGLSPTPEPITATTAAAPADGRASPYPHEGEWAVAIRELEEQAIVAANQHQLRQQLSEARAETEKLQGENETLRATLAAVQAEEGCLREDAQNAVFRNGVLSQQVVSLLVKVERLRRDLRDLREVPHQAPADTESRAEGTSSRPQTRSASASTASSAGPFGGSTTRPQTRARQHTIAWGGPRDAVDASSSACAAAAASQQLLQRRAPQAGSSWLTLNGSPSALDRTASSPGSRRDASMGSPAPLSDPAHRLSTSTLRGTDGQLQRAVYSTSSSTAAAAAQAAQPRARDPFLSFSDDVLETTAGVGPGSGVGAGVASPPWSTLEYERGVSRNLRTLGRRTWTRSFGDHSEAASREQGSADNTSPGTSGSGRGSGRRRVFALRNLGSSALEVSLPCVPRLPASDRLSGVALGRPSAYSVLDPRTGLVARQLTSAEATLATQRQSERSQAGAPAARSSSSAPPLMEESAEDVLAILDMLESEDLGGLERYSANTVSELVLRNQELLVQLYKVTQRAEQAETKERALARVVHGDAPMHAKSLIARGDGAAPEERPVLIDGHRRDEARESPGSSVGAGAPQEEEGGSEQDGSHTAAEPGHKRTRREEGPASDADEAEADNLAKAATVPPPPPSSRGLSDRGTALVRQLMDDVLERHDVAIAWTDESVTSALVDVLQTMRPLRPIPTATEGHDDGASETAPFMDRADAAVSEAALHSVIQLCAAQAVQLAGQGLSSHEARMENIEQKSWAAAQASLQSAMTDLKATFIIPHEERLRAMQEVMQAMYETPDGVAGPLAAAVVGAGGDTGLLRVLERLRKLLHAAARKDGAVMAALAASHERQRDHLQRRMRKMRRVTRASAGVTAEQEATVSAADLEASPLLQPQVTPTTSMPSLTQPPPQLGSPVGADVAGARDRAGSGSPRLGATFPVTVGVPTQLPDHRQPCPDAECDSDDSDDDEHREAAYAALRDRLALEEAKQRKLAEELQAEKKLYLGLHERMWGLECERDDAASKLSEANARMATMLTRSEYENVVGDLDDAKQQVEDLQAQLRYLHQEKNRLQASSETLQHQLDHHEEERQKSIADTRIALQQRDQQLSQANDLTHTLRQEVSALQSHLVRFQEDARMYLEQLQASERDKMQLADDLDALRRQFLMQDSTQSLLQALYPGDAALAANAALVGVLRQEQDNLAGRLAAAELEVEEQKAAHDRLRDRLQTATQERQEAELALEAERSARLDAYNGDAGFAGAEAHAVPHDGDDETDTAMATATPGPERPMPSGLVAALRRRVQSLEAQLEASENEVRLLRDAEQAWKLREGELRHQLELMSRDPVSRAVRQYGLKACETFEDVLAQMQSRESGLIRVRDNAVDEAARVKAELAAAVEEVSTHKAHSATAQARYEHAQSELTRIQTQLTHVQDSLAEREAALSNAQAHTVMLEKRTAALERDVRDSETTRDAIKLELSRCETEKARFWEDNTKLMAKLKELQQDLTRLDAEKRAANAALAQGMNSASRHQGRHPRGGSSAPARSPLTGDLSMTPVTPSHP